MGGDGEYVSTRTEQPDLVTRTVPLQCICALTHVPQAKSWHPESRYPWGNLSTLSCDMASGTDEEGNVMSWRDWCSLCCRVSRFASVLTESHEWYRHLNWRLAWITIVVHVGRCMEISAGCMQRNNLCRRAEYRVPTAVGVT